MEQVILVNENDEVVGHMDKLEAHEKGLLHRAFSVFIFNTKGEMLLQRRAMDKYHSAGLWSNTCCSHPRPDEGVEQAASRRLKEEMGLQCELKSIFSFQYKVDFENGLTEHEMDYVLVGVTNEMPKPNRTEVMDWKFMSNLEIERELKADPEKYTYWFRLCFNDLRKHIKKSA